MCAHVWRSSIASLCLPFETEPLVLLLRIPDSWTEFSVLLMSWSSIFSKEHWNYRELLCSVLHAFRGPHTLAQQALHSGSHVLNLKVWLYNDSVTTARNNSSFSYDTGGPKRVWLGKTFNIISDTFHKNKSEGASLLEKYFMTLLTLVFSGFLTSSADPGGLLSFLTNWN